jgi:hypothetical protein
MVKAFIVSGVNTDNASAYKGLFASGMLSGINLSEDSAAVATISQSGRFLRGFPSNKESYLLTSQVGQRYCQYRSYVFSWLPCYGELRC